MHFFPSTWYIISMFYVLFEIHVLSIPTKKKHIMSQSIELYTHPNKLCVVLTIHRTLNFKKLTYSCCVCKEISTSHKNVWNTTNKHRLCGQARLSSFLSNVYF